MHSDEKSIYITDNEDRFIKLETQFLHQELKLEELHEALFEQQKIIESLNKKLNLLSDKVTASQDIGPAGEKPPHY